MLKQFRIAPIALAAASCSFIHCGDDVYLDGVPSPPDSDTIGLSNGRTSGYLRWRSGPLYNSDWFQTADGLNGSLQTGQTYEYGVMFFPYAGAFGAGIDHFVAGSVTSGNATHVGPGSYGDRLFYRGVGAIVSRTKLELEVWLGGENNFSLPRTTRIAPLVNDRWYYLYTRIRRGSTSRADVTAYLYAYVNGRWTFQAAASRNGISVPSQAFSSSKSYAGWLGHTATANPMSYVQVTRARKY